MTTFLNCSYLKILINRYDWHEKALLQKYWTCIFILELNLDRIAKKNIGNVGT